METRSGPLKRMRPGQPLAGGDANRIIQEVYQAGGDATLSAADVPLLADEGRYLIRITSGAAPTSGHKRAYTGVAVNLDSEGRIVEVSPSLVLSTYLYARSGNPSVPVDGTAIVWATPSPYGDYLEFDWDERPRWALITSGTGPYAFTEQYPSASNTWATLPNGATGTTSQNPLREVNGVTGVGNIRVRFWQGFTAGAAHIQIQRTAFGDGVSVREKHSVALINVTAGTFTLTFEGQTTSSLAYNANAAAVEAAIEGLSNVVAATVTGSGTAGSPFVVEYDDDFATHDLLISDSSSLKGDQEWLFELPGGITVKEQDGSPAYTDVITFIVDQADGFVLTQPAAGQVRLDQTAASPSTVGYVTVVAQSFAGLKTFNDGIATAAGGADIEGIITAHDGMSSEANVSILAGGLDVWESVTWHTTSAIGNIHAGIGSLIVEIYDAGLKERLIISQARVIAGAVPFAYRDALSVIYDGATASPPGTDLVFKGGLYISGTFSGAYTDESAQDAVGAMVTDGTLTYADATPLLSVTGMKESGGQALTAGTIGDTQIIFRNGTTIDGSADLAFDNTAKTLTLSTQGYLVTSRTTAPSGIPSNTVAGPFTTT